MTAKLEIAGSFRVSSVLESVDELTQLLGIKPSRSWKKGDSVLGTALKRPTNAWIIDCDLEKTADISLQIARLLHKLKDVINNSDFLKSDFDKQFLFAVYYEKERPSIFLSRETILGVAALRASIDVDLYNLSSYENGL